MPLTWVTRYQPEPDFEVGQTVLQADPATVPLTVTVALRPSLTLIELLVEVEVRMLTPSQAGARTTAAGGVDADAVVGVGVAGAAVDVGAGEAAAPGVGVEVEVGLAACAFRTPVAAYSVETP